MTRDGLPSWLMAHPARGVLRPGERRAICLGAHPSQRPRPLQASHYSTSDSHLILILTSPRFAQHLVKGGRCLRSADDGGWAVRGSSSYTGSTCRGFNDSAVAKRTDAVCSVRCLWLRARACRCAGEAGSAGAAAGVRWAAAKDALQQLRLSVTCAPSTKRSPVAPSLRQDAVSYGGTYSSFGRWDD